MSFTGQFIVQVVSRSLTLDNTVDTDSGTYTCAASNVAANMTQDFELIVQGELLFMFSCKCFGQKLVY